MDSTALMAAVLAFISVAGLGWVFAGGSSSGRKGAKRLKSLGQDTRLKRGKRKVSALDQSAARRKQLQATLKELDEHQKQQRKRTLTLKARIRQAGFSFSPMAFYITTVLLGVLVAAGLFASGQKLLIALAFGFGAGFGLPRWVLGALRKRRMKKFTGEFANALDIVVRGIKTGLPLNECLKIIARESPAPVGPEFKNLIDGMAVGVDLPQGLEKMYERMPVPELNFFAIVLTIQKKTGGNLAEALENLAIVLRSRKMMREKIAALSSEAKASSMIIGSLPILVMAIVYVTTPSYMSLMFTDSLGHILLAGGAIWMGLGIFVMVKMVAFNF